MNAARQFAMITEGWMVRVWRAVDGTFIALGGAEQGFNEGQFHPHAVVGSTANEAAERAGRVTDAFIAHARPANGVGTFGGVEYRGKSATIRRDEFAAGSVSGTSKWGLGVHASNHSRPPVYDAERAVFAAITPSDSTPLARTAVALWASVAGWAAVTYEDGTTASLAVGPSASTSSNAPIAYVKSTGTTATGIVAIADGIRFGGS